MQVIVLQSPEVAEAQVHIIQTVMAVDHRHQDTVTLKGQINQVVVDNHHVVDLVQVTVRGHLDHLHSQEYNLEAAGVAAVIFAVTVVGLVADMQVAVMDVTERPAEQVGTVAQAVETVVLTVETVKVAQDTLLDKLRVVQV